MSNSQEYAAPTPATSRTRIALLILWAILTLLALSFVFTLGSNCPNADEWDFVPALLNREPLGSWLWAQHNEHRLPLPRAAYYLLFQLTHDFRSGSVLQIVLLSGTSLTLMLFAARLRGRPHWADAFFPISLVHVGHWENLLIGYNLCFAFILTLQTFIGVIALQTTPLNAFRSGLRAGLLMVLLALCGGGGLVTAMPVAVWLIYLAWIVRHEGLLRSAALLMVAALPILYLAVYLQDYHRPAHHPEVGTGGSDVFLVAGRTLAMAFGSAGSRSWLWLFGVVSGLGLFTLGGLLFQLRTKFERPAALGLIAILSGLVAVALVIGLGRAGIDPRYGLASRYAYLMWPAIALPALFWVKRGGRVGLWVLAVLCVVSVFRFNANMIAGLNHGTNVKNVLSVVEVDASNGAPAEWIVRTFPGTFQALQEERAIRAIPLLREARIGAFAEGQP